MVYTMDSQDSCFKHKNTRHTRWNLQSDVTLATVLGELRSVKDECSRLRSLMNQGNAHHIEALKAEWSRMTSELTTKQNGMVNRLARIEGHLTHVGADQNNELQSRASEMNLRIQDISPNMELRSRSREAQGLPHQELVNKMERKAKLAAKAL